MSKELKFPDGFLWGSATSSYQVEGEIENNDWAQAGRDGKVPLAGKACDDYHRYEEDFDIAKSLSQNAHRFSIEWSRIEPEEGKFDQQAIEHYRKVLQALRDRGLEPFVTLYHWTLPIWFVKRGGWLAKDSHQIFSRFVERVVGEYKDFVTFWITINEPLIYSNGSFLRGNWPPFNKNIFKFLGVLDQLVMSHNVVYDKIKEIAPNSQVGIAKHNINFESNQNPFNRLLSSFMIYFWNHRFLEKIQSKQDFIGLNYYLHRKFGDSGTYEKADNNWDIYPKGIFNVLMELKKYRNPVYVTENGIADAQDHKRTQFIKDHLKWVHEAIQSGIDVRGYFYWSLMDNFEWAKGFDIRFGLVEVNYDTMERHVRPSAYEYKKICESNSLNF